MVRPLSWSEWRDIHLKSVRLRVHTSQEWHDLYQTSTSDELQKFFDCYLKDIENGWEQTPKARVSLLTFDEVSDLLGFACTTTPKILSLGPNYQQNLYRVADSQCCKPDPVFVPQW